MNAKAIDNRTALSLFYKALAHPVRLAIIERLLISETSICKDFVTEFNFAQATVSEHLRKLKQAQLISVCKKGSASEYSLNKEQLRQLIKLHQHRIELHLFPSLSSY